MKLTIVIQALLLLLLPLSGWARELSLEQALEMAREHSFSLQKARALASSSHSDLGAAKAERFPTFSAVGSGNYISEVAKMTIALPTLPPIEREIGTHENYQADFRLNFPLYTCGEITREINLATGSTLQLAAPYSAELG